MKHHYRSIFVFFGALVLGHCNNYGMLETISSAASGKLGYLVFSQGNFSGAPFIDASCTGFPTVAERANCTCNIVAKSNGYDKLGNNFKAWLSTSVTDAICNVQGLSGTSCGSPSELGPLIRIESNCGSGGCQSHFGLFASTVNELLTTGPIVPLYNVNYTGQSLMWTGTGLNGRAIVANNCGDWTSGTGVAGDGRKSGAAWTNDGQGYTCGSSSGSYHCFEELR